MRTIAGIASGLHFVCITQCIPSATCRPHDAGIVCCGLGFGIFVSGAIVLASGSIANRQQLWLICAIVSAAFTVIVWNWPIPARGAPPAHAHRSGSTVGSSAVSTFDANRRQPMLILSAGYFFQGGGYIIIGTYLVVLAEPVIGDTAAASTWIVAGQKGQTPWSLATPNRSDLRGMFSCRQNSAGRQRGNREE